MAWCCTEGDRAYVGERPVIESLAQELEGTVGTEVFVELRRRLTSDDSRFAPGTAGQLDREAWRPGISLRGAEPMIAGYRTQEGPPWGSTPRTGPRGTREPSGPTSPGLPDSESSARMQ